MEYAFTKCPECDTKTKIRKFCLVIHVEPRHLLSLNKICRYCPYCDLIIVKKQELEQLLCITCEQNNFSEIIGNEYTVYGTVERKIWKQGQQKKLDAKQLINSMYLFKNIWLFEVNPGGWVYNPDKAETSRL